MNEKMIWEIKKKCLLSNTYRFKIEEILCSFIGTLLWNILKQSIDFGGLRNRFYNISHTWIATENYDNISVKRIF